MSVETLKKLKTVSWVDVKNTLPGDFGPPAYDETTRSYMWRIFKRGFTWGKETKRFLLT